jgi:hypothetical protein
MSVNISAHDLAHPALVARVSRALVEAGLQPAQLTLELTENILMSHIDGAIDKLAALRQLGVHLAVDDFGIGYTSLSHLSRLPISSLKIDRSFVSQLKPGSDDTAVVSAIIQLGGTLRKAVVAEGIESSAQMAQLQDMGCRYGQGFHLILVLIGAMAVMRWMYASIVQVRRWSLRVLALLILCMSLRPSHHVRPPLQFALEHFHPGFNALAIVASVLGDLLMPLAVAFALCRLSFATERASLLATLDRRLARGRLAYLNKLLDLPRTPFARPRAAVAYVLALAGALVLVASAMFLLTVGGTGNKLNTLVTVCLNHPEFRRDCLEQSAQWAWSVPIGLVLALMGVKLAAFLRACSRRIGALSVHDVLLRDDAPFLLYLRPFEVDDVVLPQPHLPWLSRYFSLRPFPVRIEEELFDVADGYRPLVAIGKPGTNGVVAGRNAYRVFLADAAWQDYALDKIRRAERIVMVLQTSPGVRWEFDRVLAAAATCSSPLPSPRRCASRARRAGSRCTLPMNCGRPPCRPRGSSAGSRSRRPPGALPGSRGAPAPRRGSCPSRRARCGRAAPRRTPAARRPASRVQPRLVAQDVAVAREPLHALQHRRGRQVHLSASFRLLMRPSACSTRRMRRSILSSHGRRCWRGSMADDFSRSRVHSPYPFRRSSSEYSARSCPAPMSPADDPRPPALPYRPSRGGGRRCCRTAGPPGLGRRCGHGHGPGCSGARPPGAVLGHGVAAARIPDQQRRGPGLMRLAEALLRVPDAETAIALTADQLGRADFDSDAADGPHRMLASLSASAIALSQEASCRTARDAGDPPGLLQRLGAKTVVAATVRAIQLLGRQFVLGRSIDEGRWARRTRQRKPAAAPCASATTCWARARAPSATPSATWPPTATPSSASPAVAAAPGRCRPTASRSSSARCSRATRSAARARLRRAAAARAAAGRPGRAANMNLTIDAEESDRLELSLDLFEALAARVAQRTRSGRLRPGGAGLPDARAGGGRRGGPSRAATGLRFMVRLVKGAYWDGEIKRAQEAGLAGYPVFTHKHHTDLSTWPARRR